jgi:AhpD family alkylhydroperoxidase
MAPTSTQKAETRRLLGTLALLAVAGLGALPSAAETSPLSMQQARKQTPELQKVHDDIRATLGIVPQMFRQFPEEGLAGAWETFKSLQLNPRTALSGRHKELIGLAVAAQVPCRFCVHFHTEAARLNQAGDRELREALAMAALTRQWSAVLNGARIDEEVFQKEMDKMLAFSRQQGGEAADGAKRAEAPANPVEATLQDVQATFGFVPSFVKAFPEEALPGAWKEMKGLQLNPNTALAPKHKELIGLAVASQIPCAMCSYSHTAAAKAAGATDRELREAVAMAALTRHWSTVLNGIQMEEAAFKREAKQILDHVRKKMKAPQSLAGQAVLPEDKAPVRSGSGNLND